MEIDEAANILEGYVTDNVELKAAIYIAIDAIHYVASLEKGPLSDDEREVLEYYILKDTPKKKVVNAGNRGRNYYCGRCGKQVPDDQAFCYKCGQRLISEKEIMLRLRSEVQGVEE